MNVLSLFDGISCGQLALRKAGIVYDNYYSSEINKYSISVTNHNFPNTFQIGDVKLLTNLTNIDLLLAGSPCQGFSKAGKQLNFEDPRSKLFFEFIRILEEVKPKYFILENNKMKKEYEDIITNLLGVEPLRINSALVSAQNRSRLYWTNIPNVTIPTDRNIFLKDLIGEYDGIWVYPRGYNKGGLQGYKGKSPTITTSSWQHNFFIVKNGEKIKFPIEVCEMLQTIPIDYTKVPVISENQRYKLIGNAWTVDVIAHILSFIKCTL